MFLFYLLLDRLSHKRPTAIQLNDSYYFIFDEKGVTKHQVIANLVYQDEMRLKQCWALTDNNTHITKPPAVLSVNSRYTIMTTSPKPEWKSWIKQAEGVWLVMDPPSVAEIAAIL